MVPREQHEEILLAEAMEVETQNGRRNSTRLGGRFVIFANYVFQLRGCGQSLELDLQTREKRKV